MGTQLHSKGAQQPPYFRPMSIVAKRSPISATAEHLSTCSKWRLYAILDILYACLDLPRRAFDGLYRCAKFNWYWWSSFDTIVFFIFCEFFFKMPIGGLDPLNGYWGRISPKLQWHILARKASYDVQIVKICPPLRPIRVTNWPKIKRNSYRGKLGIRPDLPRGRNSSAIVLNFNFLSTSVQRCRKRGIEFALFHYFIHWLIYDVLYYSALQFERYVTKNTIGVIMNFRYRQHYRIVTSFYGRAA